MTKLKANGKSSIRDLCSLFMEHVIISARTSAQQFMGRRRSDLGVGGSKGRLSQPLITPSINDSWKRRDTNLN